MNFLLTPPSGFMITRMTEQIDQFFRPDGTLISIPVKLHKKLAVLRHIASELSPDTKYPEKQLNEIIAKYHPDTAALRRYMIEYGILERDGESVYWITPKK
jgi:hypothetical protein